MDLKIINKEKHKFWTGRSNEIIIKNLEQVKTSGKPFIIRVPLIPGVNDDEANKEATAKLLIGATNLERIELMPYHTTAGAKYVMVGKEYNPGFDISAKPDTSIDVFKKYGLPVFVL